MDIFFEIFVSCQLNLVSTSKAIKVKLVFLDVTSGHRDKL